MLIVRAVRADVETATDGLSEEDHWLLIPMPEHWAKDIQRRAQGIEMALATSGATNMTAGWSIMQGCYLLNETQLRAVFDGIPAEPDAEDSCSVADHLMEVDTEELLDLFESTYQKLQTMAVQMHWLSIDTGRNPAGGSVTSWHLYSNDHNDLAHGVIPTSITSAPASPDLLDPKSTIKA